MIWRTDNEKEEDGKGNGCVRLDGHCRNRCHAAVVCEASDVGVTHERWQSQAEESACCVSQVWHGQR